MLNNEAVKYLNNDETNPQNLVLGYKSQEIENKLRIEHSMTAGTWQVMTGGGYEYVKYNNNTNNKIFTAAGPEEILFNTDISMHKYALFGSASRKFSDDKIQLSLGARFDGNSYSSDMSNPLKQFSPRLSLSWKLSEKTAWNFNTGRYFQLPPYTALGYTAGGELVNKANNIKYIGVTHLVTGLEYNYNDYGRVTVEGFYKWYTNYPLLLRENISLANLGGDFGIIGNEPVIPSSSGRSYGMEFLVQQRLYKGFYGILAYTLGWSQFTNTDDKYTASSWDARHIVNLTMGKRLGRNWEIGIKYRLQTGLPGTPFSADSDLVVNWDRNFAGIPDYTRINSLRNGTFNALDMRIDKKWFFKGWDLNVFFDVQNVTASAIGRDVLILNRPVDENGKPIGGGIIVNPDAPQAQQRYRLKTINDATGTVLPTIGLVLSL